MQNMLPLKVQKSPVSVGLAADDVAVQCWAASTAMATNAASSTSEARPPGELTLVIEIPSFLVNGYGFKPDKARLEHQALDARWS